MLLVESIHRPQCTSHCSQPPWLRNAAAVFISDQQGLDSLNEFHPLMDDEVEILIKVTRHPGGTIPNTASVAAGAPVHPLIPNPGKPVSLHAGNNLQLMCNLL